MNNNTLKNTKKGYIALITTLVVGSVSVAITIGLFFTGILQTQTGITIYDGMRARHYADACVEHALMAIRSDTGYTGSNNKSFPGGVCEYTVTSSGGENRTIESQGFVGDTTHRVQVEIDEINPAINVQFWQFIDSF